MPDPEDNLAEAPSAEAVEAELRQQLVALARVQDYINTVLDAYIKDPPKNELQRGHLYQALETYVHANGGTRVGDKWQWPDPAAGERYARAKVVAKW